MSDTHHFKETVNGGVLFINPNTGNGNATGVGAFFGTGVYAMQLTDFPIFQKFNSCFEFARLNKCTIEFIPKYNFQSNSNTFTGVATAFNSSTTGTFITAIDQIPFNVNVGVTSPALNWVNDNSNTGGTTSATAYTSTNVTVGYVRGLQGSREKELYKKHTISFFPAFYDYIVTGGALDVLSGASFERKIKKWVSTGFQAASGQTLVTTGNGPVYYGPVYAFDVNAYAGGATDNINIALFDIRMKYSMSFKRLKGV